MKTVKELIAYLSMFDPNLLVIVDGFEYGYDDIDLVCIKEMKRAPLVSGSYPAATDDNTLESEKVNHLYIGNSRRYE